MRKTKKRGLASKLWARRALLAKGMSDYFYKEWPTKSWAEKPRKNSLSAASRGCNYETSGTGGDSVHLGKCTSRRTSRPVTGVSGNTLARVAWSKPQSSWFRQQMRMKIDYSDGRDEEVLRIRKVYASSEVGSADNRR